MSYPPPPGPSDPDQPPPAYEQQGGQRWSQPPPFEQGGQPPPYEQHWGQPPPYAPQTPYGQYGPPGPNRPGGVNVLAVLSLVFAFVFAPAGIVLGHLARRQIRTTGEEGTRLATWGLALSYAFTALGLLLCCGWGALAFWANSEGGTNT